jgi:hypothetical protein
LRAGYITTIAAFKKRGAHGKKEFFMKNLTKLFGITVLAAVIGFTVLFAGACASKPEATQTVSKVI